ncbi:hypothetical protein [Seohaeicola zhoushanensis]|uniref:hypothetical protein n=1 Tax=Seohaeicola zhoushanensis TaxID=1569283 RepID=UPI00167AF400|nr:hypothetical protein [Seohaeicola zhoushanensis]
MRDTVSSARVALEVQSIEKVGQEAEFGKMGGVRSFVAEANVPFPLTRSRPTFAWWIAESAK